MSHKFRAGRPIALAVSALAVVSAAFLVWQPFAAASAGCLVTNANQGGSFSDLQAAIDAASNGAVLQVQGTCTGTARTSIDLKIQGVGGDGSPTLDGGGQGTVLTIEANTRVVLDSLTITNGTTKSGVQAAATAASGVANSGNVTITDSTVTANPVTQIDNAAGATTTLIDSVVSNGGGGIRNSGTLTLSGDTSVTGNVAALHPASVGGGIANYKGTVTLDGTSSITDNTAFGGGGIYNFRGIVTLNDSASIHDNTEDDPFNHTSAAGVESFYGTVTVNDNSSIYNNSCSFQGLSPRH
jgi:hypothetical protein